MDCLQVGPNADVKKWQDEQIEKAILSFVAKDAKEKAKVSVEIIVSIYIIYTKYPSFVTRSLCHRLVVTANSTGCCCDKP